MRQFGMLLILGTRLAASAQEVPYYPPSRPPVERVPAERFRYAQRWSMALKGAVRIESPLRVRDSFDGRITTTQVEQMLWGLEAGYAFGQRWAVETGFNRVSVNVHLHLASPPNITGLEASRRYQVQGYTLPLRVKCRLTPPASDQDPHSGLYLTGGGALFFAGEQRRLGGFGYRLIFRPSPQSPVADTVRFIQLCHQHRRSARPARSGPRIRTAARAAPRAGGSRPVHVRAIADPAKFNSGTGHGATSAGGTPRQPRKCLPAGLGPALPLPGGAVGPVLTRGYLRIQAKALTFSCLCGTAAA